MSHQSSPNRDENAKARVALALSLRSKKLPYEQIAHQCGYKDESGARKAVKHALERTVVKNVEELRAEELVMLDRLHQECWELAMDKDNKGRLFAVDRVLAISERRCKLMGLDIKPEEAEPRQVIIREVPQGLLPKPIVEGTP